MISLIGHYIVVFKMPPPFANHSFNKTSLIGKSQSCARNI